jgi:hypothetical protein
LLIAAAQHTVIKISRRTKLVFCLFLSRPLPSVPEVSLSAPYAIHEGEGEDWIKSEKRGRESRQKAQRGALKKRQQDIERVEKKKESPHSFDVAF